MNNGALCFLYLIEFVEDHLQPNNTCFSRLKIFSEEGKNLFHFPLGTCIIFRTRIIFSAYQIACAFRTSPLTIRKIGLSACQLTIFRQTFLLFALDKLENLGEYK